MTSTVELRREVKEMQAKLWEVLKDCCTRSAEDVIAALPDDGEQFSAIHAARLRWAMLKGGFTHSEIVAMTSRLNKLHEAGKTPNTEVEWEEFVAEEYLKMGSIDDDTHRATLYILHQRYSTRLENPQLNAHEKMIYVLGKRINRCLDAHPTLKEDLVETLASETKLPTEMIWRISTGGLRVAGVLLEKIGRAVSRMEENLEVERV